ncbi:MAG: rhamnulokinase [Prevotella sp.]|nr:rhamnulokinase [Prevotella sp.]
MKNYFAVDLGATSGRTIIGTLNDGRLEQQELTRFTTPLVQACGHFYWDIFTLYEEIIKGLRTAKEKNIEITSIGIDTWGVDFVFIGKDGQPLRNPVAYRDPHTMGVMEDYFEEQISREDVYDITGIQFMNFNSLFQLYAMRKAGNSALEVADKILFMPDALSYMLTAEAVCEYTIASTSQILDPRTREMSEALLVSIGVKRSQFGRMVQPGTIIGTLTPEVQRITGLGPVPVVAVAGHDTASAVAAVPARDSHFAYLSSGTWSLMGIETQQPVINSESSRLNFTNEGGIEGTTRFLKNICGMWIYERCRAEYEGGKPSHAVLLQEALQCEEGVSIINPDDPSFTNPPKMTEAIAEYCRKTGQPVPQTRGQFTRCIFDSLVARYREVFGWLKDFADFDIKTLHIIGGGSVNEYLNQSTANALGIEVVAGPQECTAIGNIMMQAKAAGDVDDIWQMRAIISNSVTAKTYLPQ